MPTKSGPPPYRRRRRSIADIDLDDFVERHVITATVVELSCVVRTDACAAMTFAFSRVPPFSR
jgi:hypothetical protein